MGVVVCVFPLGTCVCKCAAQCRFRLIGPVSSTSRALMAASTSSASGQALAPAQGKASGRPPALASAQGEAVVVVSYNIGARQANSHTSKQNFAKFHRKFSEDIKTMLLYHAEVINFQEINDFWKGHVLADMLPVGWQPTYSESMTLLTIVAPGLEILSHQCVSVFPDARSKIKQAHFVLNTQICRPCASAGQIWSIWNNHTVSGSSSPWKITGTIMLLLFEYHTVAFTTYLPS